MSPTIEPHEPHWMSKAAFPVVMAAFYITQIALGVAVYHSLHWLTISLVLLSSHLMHGALIALHEASHGLLRKKRLLNEIDGTLIAAFSLTSFSLYRVVHQSHHAHLATERDEELWPFVKPGVSRPARILAVVLELGLGFLYTPFLFVRAFLRPGSTIRRKDLRRRIRLELWLTVALWTVILAAVAWWGLWKYLFWLYLAPAWLAGSMQSLRKYIEHVGLTGTTINSSTRSIVAHGWLGKLVAFSLLHEPFHGVHHKHSGLPHAKLPQFVAVLDPVMPDERPPFPNYRQAFRDLFQSLADPRVGAQWNATHLEPSRHLTKVG